MSRNKKKNNGKKNKKYRWLILLFIVLIIIGLVYGYLRYKKIKELEEIEKNMVHVILIDDLSVEINSEVVLGDFINNIVNGEILNGEEVVDTSKLGDSKHILKIKNKYEEEEEYDFKIEVVDTVKPVIDAKKEISSYVGKKVNLLDGVKVTDNSKEEIVAHVVGEYNVDKVGKYELKYEAIDSSGNKEEYQFVLNVNSDPNNRTFTTSKGFSAKVIDGVTYIDGVLVVNKTYSVPSSYGSGLTSETQEAFNKMKADASALGLNLWLASGYRSYSLQKSIYNNYVSWDGQANADTYSARPGHSEHQTGLAFDLNTIEDSFANTDEGKWVVDHCYQYGLILRYPKGKDSITGYKYESWHMRYVGVELATKLYNNGDWVTLEEYFGIDSKYS